MAALAAIYAAKASDWATKGCRAQTPMLSARHPTERLRAFRFANSSGRSSGVEHNLAKVGVEGSNPFARSKFSKENKRLFLARFLLNRKNAYTDRGRISRLEPDFGSRGIA